MPKPSLSGNLDLLRTIAVMAVFFHHFAQAAWHNDGFETLGRFGVILFFVHTSCVLMSSLQRMEASAPSRLSLTLAFWLRRFFRIYPLGVLCVLSVAFFQIPQTPLASYRWIGFKSFLANLALSQNLTSSPNILGPLWSLPLEVQMYLVLPLAYFAVRKCRYGSLALWGLSLFPIFLFSRVALQRPFELLMFAPCFIAGIISFDLAPIVKPAVKLPPWVWPLGILALLVLFRPYDPAGFSEKYPQCWGLALGIGLLYPFVNEARSNSLYKSCHWIAERSYGIYLSHCIVLWIVFHCMAASPLWLRIPALVAGALGIPSLLYTGIERPAVRAGTRMASSYLRRSRPEVAPAVV